MSDVDMFFLSKLKSSVRTEMLRKIEMFWLLFFFSRLNTMYWKYFILKINRLKDLLHGNNKINSNYYFFL